MILQIFGSGNQWVLATSTQVRYYDADLFALNSKGHHMEVVVG